LLGYLRQDGAEFRQEAAKLCITTIASGSTYIIILCLQGFEGEETGKISYLVWKFGAHPMIKRRRLYLLMQLLHT
jgi:hypothetical protein